MDYSKSIRAKTGLLLMLEVKNDMLEKRVQIISEFTADVC